MMPDEFRPGSVGARQRRTSSRPARRVRVGVRAQRPARKPQPPQGSCLTADTKTETFRVETFAHLPGPLPKYARAGEPLCRSGYSS